jgi:adenine-specific DNA-methyltransferase
LDSRTNQRYYIECPDGSFVIPPGNVFPEEVKDGAKVIPESNQDKCWRWSHDTYLKKKDMLLFTHARKNCPLVDENGNPSKWNVYDKVYFEAEEHKSFLPEDIIYDYPNSQGTKELLDLGINFSFAKPTGLVKYLMEIVHFNSDDIILDFFSGSGTTGDACMRLNQEDNGTRRFILVQTPEVIEEKTEEFKEGFKTISEIGKERLRRIGEKLVLENPDNNTDFGFRVYKIRED